MIAEKVANALALDWPRERLEVIVAVDGGAGRARTPPRSAPGRPAPTWCSSCRAAARCAPRTPPCAPRAATCSPSPTPTRCGSRTRCARLAAAFADPAVGYACGQVRFVNDDGTNQEGLYWRYELWLRAQESALASVTAGNGAIYAVRREAYVEVEPVMGHDLSLPFPMVKRGRRAVYVARGAGDREDGADDRGRVAPQAADDEPRLADRPARRAARPARLPAALRADGRLAPAAALRLAVPARPRVRRGRCPRRAGRSTAPPLAPRRRCWRRRSRAAACAPARCSLARYYVLTTAAIAAGLYDHLRHGTPAGWDAAGGHAMSRTAAARARRRAGAAWRSSLVARRCWRSRRCDPARVPRAPDLPPAPRRPRRAAVRRLQAAHDGHRRRAPGRRASPSTQGDARITRVGALLRRTSLDELPNLVNVLRGRDVARRPAPDRPGPGRPLHRAPARPPGRAARHHGLGAGQRPRVAALARAHRARPLVHRARLARARPPDPVADALRMVAGGHGPLPRRDRRLARAAARATGPAPGPCRCSASRNVRKASKTLSVISGQVERSASTPWRRPSQACSSCSGTAACGSRRRPRPAAPRAGRRPPSACPARTGRRCGRARACGRACRGSGSLPGA